MSGRIPKRFSPFDTRVTIESTKVVKEIEEIDLEPGHSSSAYFGDKSQKALKPT